MTEFLKLNGITIPVEDGSAEFGYEEFGQRSRAMDGSLRTTRTAIKRRWKFRTPILDPETALMVAGLLGGAGHHWGFDVDAYDLKGYGPLDVATPGVYSLRKGSTDLIPQPAEYGMKYGGALAVEDGTTNLYAQNVRTGTDSGSNTTGFTGVNAPSAMLSQDLPALGVGRVALQGVRVLEFTAAGAVDGIRGGIKTNGVVGAALTTYTASVYVQADKAIRCQLKDVTNGVNGSVQSLTPPALGDKEWRRISSTVTTGAAVPTLEFEVLEDTADTAANAYCDQFQLEAKLYPTSWADGTRAAGIFKCDVQSFLTSGRVVAEDLRSAVDLTVMGWISYNKELAALEDRAIFWLCENPLLATNPPYQGHYLGLEVQTISGSIIWNVEAGGRDDPTPSAGTPVTFTGTLAANAWAHFAVVVRRNSKFGSDQNTLKLYVDGVLRDESLMTGANESLPNFSKIKAFYLGTAGGYGGTPKRFTGGMIDDVVIVPYALTAGGIKAVADTGRAFTDLPRLDAEGLATVTPPPRALVMGDLPSGELVQASLSGTWVANQRTVEIILSEV